ncbi:DUF433 domain-containing protein [Mesorhizobium sp. BE184]|uniref:DUF433 domain-containing protein n=1 Tax=Mesorhizobium sp. BE184 TaxID=2817714 RepID=UPI002864144F|nr:DUF433 domain-containing protein [Mesorhizobium sp. BE184]MDR7034404.1 uncharacterized protein (DUF433 family) [Mesorhizobium sp. BE184]
MDVSAHNAVISAFSEDHAVRITGLTKGQLRAWDRRGFFIPKLAYEKRYHAYSRIYSFKDVVGLKTLSVLRNRFHVSFVELKRVAAELTKRGYDHWADTKLYVVKKAIHFFDRDTGKVESLRDGQFAMLPIIDVINEVEIKITELKTRSNSQIGHVNRNKYLMRNSWVVSGTRIPTAAIRRYFDAGYSVDHILKEYPSLTREDVRTALNHENALAKSA